MAYSKGDATTLFACCLVPFLALSLHKRESEVKRVRSGDPSPLAPPSRSVEALFFRQDVRFAWCERRLALMLGRGGGGGGGGGVGGGRRRQTFFSTLQTANLFSGDI
ncbi:unnamed protein product [Heligmosomoides polygyrus]|uniref:Secreted protein n=1 Tax=Heligmosomoides polygyrus TaxID=6339 RepID=A0A183FUN1_HELPZ|nr:unnamed protein product [Heligmosomoides polygyrus]